MKKALSVLVLLLVVAFQATTLEASVVRFYQGNTSPGQYIDSFGHENLAFYSGPWPNSSPAPYEGDHNIAGPLHCSGGDQRLFQDMAPWFSTSAGTVAVPFYYDQNGDATSTIFSFDGPGVNFALYIDSSAPTSVVTYYSGTGGPNGTATSDVVTAGQFNVVYFTWTGAGSSLSINGGAPVTNGTALQNYTTFTLGGGVLVCDATSLNLTVDAIMFSPDADEVYPPSVPTPTITPTHSITPTFSSTSTITKTRTITVTSTVTPTNTPTPTITTTAAVMPPTGVRLGVLQPSSSILISWDADPLPSNWFIYFNGAQAYSVPRTSISTSVSGVYSYLMQNLPPNKDITATMFASTAGKPLSPPSSPVTFNTAAAPFSYYLPLGVSTLDRFTAIGTSSVYHVAGAVQKYSISVCGEGGNLTSWTVNLQGSLDGTNFTTILIHDNGAIECSALSSGAAFYPFTYLRLNVSAIDLGTASDALVIATGLP